MVGVTHYDVVVLGAGPGGYVAAIRAAQLGLNTAIVEPKYWGGVCLNVGCIPSKALLRNAELAHIFTKEAKTFGISGEAQLRLRRRLRPQPQGRRRPRRGRALPDEEEQDHRDPRLRQVHRRQQHRGRPERRRDRDGRVRQRDHRDRLHAPGWCPARRCRENVVTYEKQIMTEELPESIIIAGAGAIGMEFAYVLKNYGVDVTIVEFLPRALPNEDAEVSKEIEKQYKKLGVKILTGTKVETIDDDGRAGHRDGAPRTARPRSSKADKVMQAIGFAPNVEGFGLEKTGVELTERKRHRHRRLHAHQRAAHLRHRRRHRPSCSSPTWPRRMGVVAAETIAGAETLALGDYRMMPRATFCQPQVASFGLTEEQAKDEGYDVNVAKFPFTANGKAHGLGDPTGFVKLIADKKYGELLGGHLIGPDVTELLPELTLAQKWDLTANEMARNVHTHPTLSEALQECFHGLVGHMINF